MSTNDINDAEMADCDEEKVVTMMDVLKEQEDFEEDANAVLGASDDKNCTYSKGYVKRQAIYACMTCCTDAKNDPSKLAGVCLACSLTCHENHELIELYTKRNFRCDCGNSKFNSHPCQFTPKKTDLNIENIYNQNFSGVYCICHRPYPDPDTSTQGDMIQCIICEDWLHSNHLDAVVPSNEQYSEMICKACMDKNEFLHDYSDFLINKENINVDILNTSTEANFIGHSNGSSNTEIAENESIANSISEDITIEQTENEAVVKNINDEDETKKVEESGTKSQSDKEDSIMEEQSSIKTSEKNLAPSELTSTNLIENELESDNKTEIEQKSDTQSEEIQTSKGSTQEIIDNTDKNLSSLIEEATPLNKIESPDNRSQEQVDEDLLLADPMDINLDQKDNISVVAPTSAIKSTTDGLIDETESKSKSEAMELCINEGQVEQTEDKNDSKFDRMPITKQFESIAIVEESDNVTNADISESVATGGDSETEASTNKSHNIITTEPLEIEPVKQTEGADLTGQNDDVPTTTIEHSENIQDENEANTEDSKSIPIAEQSKIAPISEQSESIPTPKNIDNISTDISQNVSTIEESDNVVTIEQFEQRDKNVNNENDVSVKENNTDDSINSDIKKNDTEISSHFDDELPDKTIEIPKRKLSSDGDSENIEVKKQKLEHSKCVRPRGVNKVYHGATFWPSDFRHKLCTCNECILMYKDLSVLFLIDPEDTVTAYERLGKEKTDGKPASQYEKGMAALSSLGRVQQINALTEYAKLRDKLLDFLKTFKDKKVIVKEEDIKAFFAGMKPVREPDGVYFCR